MATPSDHTALPKSTVLELPSMGVVRRQFTSYVSNCLAGLRTPKKVFANTLPMQPGQRVRATDRIYERQPDGSFRVVERSAPVPPAESQIYVAARPNPKDKYGNARLAR